jgi:hypothetical protein
MSKIQEALKRLQSENRPDGQPVAVAKISDRVVDLDDTANLEQVSPSIFIEIDEEVLREEGLIAPAGYEREIADQYRQIKRPLIASAFGKRAAKVDDGAIIMVTSIDQSCNEYGAGKRSLRIAGGCGCCEATYFENSRYRGSGRFAGSGR